MLVSRRFLFEIIDETLNFAVLAKHVRLCPILEGIMLISSKDADLDILINRPEEDAHAKIYWNCSLTQ